MGGSLSTIRWDPSGLAIQIGQDDHGRRNNQQQGGGRGGRQLHKSKSYPPPGGTNTNNNNPSDQSPSSSTTNLTYENDTDDDELHTGGSHHSSEGHLGTSGILMGVNAPPLYDACLVGRWDEVLEILGVPESNEGNDENNSSSNAENRVNSELSTVTTKGSCTPPSVTGSSTEGGANRGKCSDAASGGEGGEAGEPLSPIEHIGDIDAGVEGKSSDETEKPHIRPGNYQEEGEGAPQSYTSLAQEGRGTPPTSPSPPSSSSSPCIQTRYADRRRNTPLHLACRRQPPPSVIRALLNQSPCEYSMRRTADGLTPLHFAAYCGADVEVVSMLVDRMRSDAAVMKAAKLTLDLTFDEKDELDNDEDDESENDVTGNNSSGDKVHSRLNPEPVELPPTRILDRRQRTPLHCALSGFRTPIRPLIVRKLLAVDPSSSTLPDERGRTPLSLLFDDYAEEIMEALEDDVSAQECKDLISKGGELYECWRMLRVLLEGAYLGSVCEDDVEEDEGDVGGSVEKKLGHEGTISEMVDTTTEMSFVSPLKSGLTPPPQDRKPRHHPLGSKEMNVVDIYDHEQFSMVHAAAGVWECPAPLAKLVLKCLCSGSNENNNNHIMDDSLRYQSYGDWNHSIDETKSASEVVGDNTLQGRGKDVIRQLDNETMRLPLHIAVCARPQCREAYSARLRTWLSSTPEVMRGLPRQPSYGSLASGITTSTLATHPGKGRESTKGQVYNPRFGRSPSKDNVVAYNSSQRRASTTSNMSSAASTAGSLAGSLLSRSGSNSSMTANIAREPFLQHTMVRDILELYPMAAGVVDDRTGKLPIVLAIEHGKSWETAVGPLLDSYPTPFGGGGDGGMALPDHSEEAKAHRAAVQEALFTALSSPEVLVREEAIRTAGKLVQWGGVYGMVGSLDGVVCEWLDMMANATSTASAASPEGIIVGPGATPSDSDRVQIQTSHLSAVAEVVSNARTDAISDRVARLCLDTSREYLYSKDGTVREAAARVLGNTLNSVGDADDAANVIKEVVLNMNISDDGSVVSSTSTLLGGRKEDVIAKHGRLLACNSILSTQWGCELMATEDIRNAILSFIHKSVKDRNTVVRSAAYHAIGPILGKSQVPDSPATQLSPSLSTNTMLILKELRSDILKGTRASENTDVQLALARGLTSASRMYPNIFLCKQGMPIMDATLMLAMSSSSARSPNVQKSFQIFLWVALEMGSYQGNDDTGSVDGGGSISGDPMTSGLKKYIELAEGENGRIMMKFVTQTLAKIEDLDDQRL